jgi:hypothetical protein
VQALSQENRRFLSCQGQINCKPFPPLKPMALQRLAEFIARRRRNPDAVFRSAGVPGKHIQPFASSGASINL